MPKVNEERRGDHYYLGMKREEWVVQAAKALIGSTDAELRFLMLKAGFVHFERKTRVEFQEQSGIRFTSAELRKIYLAIEWWTVKKGEQRLMWGMYERVYQRMRRGEAFKASDLREMSKQFHQAIITENANGQRRVH